MKTAHGICIVALNTNLYYKSDKVTEGLTEPAHQFLRLKGIFSVFKKASGKGIRHVLPVIAEKVRQPWMHMNFHNELNNII
ncbi:hypothetical protein KUTeg_005334 [Tegillarca granosa]|uniref:Uncharacterized protein n=1 Tax=Tegillarca granosa TaxID=220873 RepID=A0ABQ9FNY2_TEGGR|nr:hypothetical protein KUTeg_005334 [Tegillarca granosa]